MKTLYLARHAKSNKEDIDVVDFDRPLNEKGYSDAHLAGRYLSEQKILPGLVISSPAIRAISTAIILSSHMKYAMENIKMKKELYDTGVNQYLRCISSIRQEESIMLVAHNETISEVAAKLSSQRIDSLKTCGIIGLRFETTSWKEVIGMKGTLFFQIHPEMLKNR